MILSMKLHPPELQIDETRRMFAKYVFVDVVQFSEGRSVEAQAEIVRVLSNLVEASLRENNIESSACLLLPTGDGMCISLLEPIKYDLHMRVALSLLHELDKYNHSTTDHTRRFQLRIGINQNTDTLFSDINNRPNLAGAGINLASRIMGVGDGNQIFVSPTVFDELQPREKYMGKFRRYTAKIKHGQRIEVHQFISQGHRGLNTNVPAEFDPALTELVAYYFAHAIVNRDAILNALRTSKSSTAHAIVIMLYLLALDSFERSHASETQPYNDLWHDDLTFEEQIANYSNATLRGHESTDLLHWKRGFRLNAAFAERLFFDIFGKYCPAYIDTSRSIWACLFVSDKGKEKLKREWPDIWNEFHLG
jgi:hypothetical protein